MTPEQRDRLMEVLRVGVTQGFSDLYCCLEAYERFCLSDLFSKGTDTEHMRWAAYEAVAAFLQDCGPGDPSGDPYTVEGVERLVVDRLGRCCFPGCYQVGLHKVPNKENTNLKLCDVHQDCLKGPEL